MPFKPRSVLPAALLLAGLFFIASCTNPEGTPSKTSDSTSIAGLTDLIRANPRNAELFHLRSRANFNAGILLDAIKDAEIAIKLDSLKPEYRFSLAEYHLQTGESGKSHTILLETTRRFPENPEVFLKLGQLYLFVQDYNKAMEQILKAQELDKDRPDVYFIKGLIYKEMGDSTRSARNFQITLDKNPDHYDAFMELGALNARQRNPLAIDYFHGAIRLQPKRIEAHYFLAYFFQENKKWDQALPLYKFIVDSLDPNYLNAWYNMGYIHLEYSGKPREALPLFDKALEIKPNFYQALYNKGYAFEKLGDVKSAEENYRKALQVLPNYPLAVAGLNRLDEKAGRR